MEAVTDEYQNELNDHLIQLSSGVNLLNHTVDSDSLRVHLIQDFLTKHISPGAIGAAEKFTDQIEDVELQNWAHISIVQAIGDYLDERYESTEYYFKSQPEYQAESVKFYSNIVNRTNEMLDTRELNEEQLVALLQLVTHRATATEYGAINEQSALSLLAGKILETVTKENPLGDYEDYISLANEAKDLHATEKFFLRKALEVLAQDPNKSIEDLKKYFDRAKWTLKDEARDEVMSLALAILEDKDTNPTIEEKMGLLRKKKVVRPSEREVAANELEEWIFESSLWHHALKHRQDWLSGYLWLVPLQNEEKVSRRLTDRFAEKIIAMGSDGDYVEAGSLLEYLVEFIPTVERQKEVRDRVIAELRNKVKNPKVQEDSDSTAIDQKLINKVFGHQR